MRCRAGVLGALGLIVRTAAAALLAAAPTPVGAHEFTLESLMNAFVKIEPDRAQLVVRVPLHVLKGARFPTSGREVDIAGAGAAVDRSLAEIDRGIAIWEGGRRLVPSRVVGRLALPSDRSFAEYREAVAHVAAPVAPGTVIFADQGYLDAHLTYPIASPDSRFTIQTTMAPDLREYLKLAVRYVPLRDGERAMLITSRSGRVALNPAWYQAAAGFVGLGIVHILSGVDHLLFLLCLVIPIRSVRETVGIVTAFTVAHSITLLGSAYDLAPAGAWFPPLVETVIAASIVYMAIENIVGADLRRRWLIAGLFGLVHGFGFSYGLKEHLQFAGRHLLVSLLSFNVGIELGQVAVLAVTLPVLAVLLRSVAAGRLGMIVLSAIVAHTGWHWMTDRVRTLSQYQFQMPELTPALMLTVLRVLMVVVLLAGAAWLITVLSRARRAGKAAREMESGA
jgi:HupE/UreJ protein